MNRLYGPNLNAAPRRGAKPLIALIAVGAVACTPSSNDKAPDSTPPPAVKYDYDELPRCESLRVRAIPGPVKEAYQLSARVENDFEPGVWNIEGVEFHFGDGTPPTPPEQDGVIEHTYPGPGEYKVSAYAILDVALEVTPPGGLQDGNPLKCGDTLHVTIK